MATEVKLPRLGQGMESGTIVRWLKSEGERVEKGEPLYELDTEKVTQEVEAEASGVLLKIAVAEGEVDVGRTVAFIGDEGEEVPSGDGGAGDGGADAGSPAKVEPHEAEAEEGAEKPGEGPEMDDERERGRQAAAEAARAETASGNGASRLEGGRVKASPLARRIAREKGVELASISGTGPEGRIVAEDVERAAAAPAPAAAPASAPAAAPARGAEPEVVPLSSTRKTIARRLTEAWAAPVFQLSVGADMSRMLDVRERLVARLREGETKPTVNDLLTKACAAALVRHPAVNAHFTGDAVHRFRVAHVGIAVAAPGGLIVPVIRDADRLTVQEIAATRAEVVDRARDGKLRREDLEGGTFTISNLGMFGVEQFVAVLNPPQAAILAVGTTEERPVVVDGALEILPMVHLTLTCDHRAIDGAEGAEFLATVKELLEEPALAL
ncbi:MAG TPA: dihydrolipoamide acetyltransferase family protein [Gaiellaceae bacterium]|nr:dihydrolipoamide acetyltransferase family protein [Gaiellaceae bacterium]